MKAKEKYTSPTVLLLHICKDRGGYVERIMGDIEPMEAGLEDFTIFIIFIFYSIIIFIPQEVCPSNPSYLIGLEIQVYFF